MARRDELNALLFQLLELRRDLARMSGLPNFLTYRWRELNPLDYTIADCQAFHHAVETIVVPAVADYHAKETTTPAAPEQSNIAMLTDGVERILTQIDPTFGTIFQTMRADYLDLGPRAHKVSSLEAWFFPRAGMPYLYLASTNVGSILHESGHAMHMVLSFQAQGSLWNSEGPEEFQEFAAMAMDQLAWPHYQEVYTSAESTAARHYVLHYYLEGLISGVMEDAFEHWVYGAAPEDVTPADLDTKWLELRARFMPWTDADLTAEEAMTGWQRWTWSLFRMPLYMITYPFALVGAACFGRVVAADRANAIENYKTALMMGKTAPLPALFQTVGLTFPFSQKMVAEGLQWILEQRKSVGKD